MDAEQAVVLRLEQPVAPERWWARESVRRTIVLAAPVVYFVALGLSVYAWGLPLARDQLFFWLVLGIAAFSVSAWRSWGSLVLAWLPFFALLVSYDFLRGAVSVAPAAAHVAPQIDFDRFIFGGTVPTVWLQQHLWTPGHPAWYDYLAWFVYMSHFFTVWIVAAVIWQVARPRFRRYAVVTVLVTLGAFLTYWLYPAQPPWLAAQAGLITTAVRLPPEVWAHMGIGAMKSVYENSGFVNTVAAMPSLHAAYPFMLLLFFWDAGTRVRILLGIYTLAMAFTLVYGGEHFVADIVAGWALTLVVFGFVHVVGQTRLGRVLTTHDPPAPSSRDRRMRLRHPAHR